MRRLYLFIVNSLNGSFMNEIKDLPFEIYYIVMFINL